MAPSKSSASASPRVETNLILTPPPGDFALSILSFRLFQFRFDEESSKYGKNHGERKPRQSILQMMVAEGLVGGHRSRKGPQVLRRGEMQHEGGDLVNLVSRQVCQ